jgi:ATP-dependent helicase/nuclease subunit A
MAAASDRQLTSAARSIGTLVHDVLRRIDFAAQDIKVEIRSWCEHLAPQHVDQHETEAAALACDLIEHFVRSPRGRQIAQANERHRELEFLFAWQDGGSGKRPGDKKQGSEKDAPVRETDATVLRGYFDCLYRDEAGWHLVDYKTNDIAAADCAQFAKQYEMQLYIYAMAAEQALGEPPVELAVHFFRPGIERTFPWNDQARHRGARFINESITQLIRLPAPPLPQP